MWPVMLQTHTDTMDADFTNVKNVDFTVPNGSVFFHQTGRHVVQWWVLAFALAKVGMALGDFVLAIMYFNQTLGHFCGRTVPGFFRGKHGERAGNVGFRV